MDFSHYLIMQMSYLKELLFYNIQFITTISSKLSGVYKNHLSSFLFFTKTRTVSDLTE